MEVISKEEFLRACNQKIQQDNDLADEERRRREEEERIRQEEERIRQEEERIRQEEAERRRREAERVAQEQREWDAWYNRLPSECKNGFDYNGFRYRVNPNIRTITKQAISNDIRENRNLTQLNRELGL